MDKLITFNPAFVQLNSGLEDYPLTIKNFFKDYFCQRARIIIAPALEYELEQQWHRQENQASDREFFNQQLLENSYFVSYFFQKFHLLENYLQILAQQGIQFAHKLHTDLKSLPADHPMKNVAQITIRNLGNETHHNGQSVLLLQGPKGAYVYKPRTIELDQLFFQYLAQVNQLLGEEFFYILSCEGGENFGLLPWVEKCNIPPEKEYFRRCGGLLAIIYSLAGVDFHFQNLLKINQYPILIDMEGLLNPSMRRQNQRDDVYSTGLLPATFWATGDKYQEVAGLTTFGDPCQYADSIVAGFSQIYTLLLQHKEELLNGEIIQNMINNQTVRIFFANTQRYWDILLMAFAPQYLRDLPTQLDYFLRTLGQGQCASELFNSEFWALRHLDIPAFFSKTGSKEVWDDRGNLLCFELEQTGRQRLLHRWQAKMSSADLKRQLWFIALSLECHHFNQFSSPMPAISGLGEISLAELIRPGVAKEIFILYPEQIDGQNWVIKRWEAESEFCQILGQLMDEPGPQSLEKIRWCLAHPLISTLPTILFKTPLITGPDGLLARYLRSLLSSWQDEC